MTRLDARRSKLAGGLLVALLVVACGAPAGTLFKTTLVGADGANAMPVTFGDTTGLVVSIEPTTLHTWLGDDPAVSADPADPNVLILSWLGGVCEHETTVGFWPVEDGFGMYVAPRGGPSLFGGGCPAAAVARAVRITLSAPVAPSQVSFSSAV